MKRILTFILISLCVASCHYLDISPEQGLTEEEVFSNYTNFCNFLNGCYDMGSGTPTVSTPKNLFFGTIPAALDQTVSRYVMSTLTDLADCGRNRDCLKIKGGSLAGCVATLYWAPMPIFVSNWICIRKANLCIQHIDDLKDCSEVEKYDILAQAYFIRAWCHMHLCIYYGGQPYVTHVLGANENGDLPRDSSIVTYRKCAEDFLTSYKYFEKCGKLRRDPAEGNGHLTNSKQSIPAGVAALAARGRCLLYAASPLSNVDNDKKYWKEAAEANALALQVALDNGYKLVSGDEWTTNWKGVAYSDEQIWAIHIGRFKANSVWYASYLPMAVSGATFGGGEFPTQQCVDLYETKWGDPLFTEGERQEAYNMNDMGVTGPDGKLHRYYEQNPYANRDPRFYETVVYDGSTAEGVKGVINIHYDPVTKSWPSTNLDGNTVFFGAEWNSSDVPNTSTGYCSRHHWNGHYKDISGSMTEPVIRLAELYLNYAEAVNMYAGPNASIGGQVSALEAVNIIRRRVGMPDVLSKFTGDAETFNKRIQNERTVEFMFEGHHYYQDERRWKIAPERMRGPLYGMFITSCSPSSQYPLGRIFERRTLSPAHQSTWKDPMYYFYLPDFETNKYQYYIDNEKW